MFKITMHKGFHIKFNNGVYVSVQFGPGNYCEHYLGWKKGYETSDLNAPRKTELWESSNAEVAIWDKHHNWITKKYKDNGDTVLSEITPDELLNILIWAKNYKQ